MKLKFLGVGSAFTTADYYQSNILVQSTGGKRLLIDCGGDIRFSLGESGIDRTNLSKEIDAIYISHLHCDHIGGLEWLAFNTYFSPDNGNRPKLYMNEGLMDELWETSLKGGLGCITGKSMDLSDYFQCCPVDGGGAFAWEGIRFTLVKLPHVLGEKRSHYSFGVFIEDPEDNSGGPVFISTDTILQPDFLAEIARKVSLIFHDCETAPIPTRVHSHYSELVRLPDSIKSKMWLYHYQPFPDEKPELHGFRGFVTKGQEFDFGGGENSLSRKAPGLPLTSSCVQK
ncbi:MAG: MBL fold metallo-hydrolase [Desulfobacteraceae bacterium]|nr:MBL fold metallo-hydrolase [Desulfobacteraceae bacterium]